MPPKAKFTKEEVIAAAIDIVRESGEENITARNLAAKLGSSPRPIFTLYESMEQVMEDTLISAYNIYLDYTRKFIEERNDYTEYKAAGRAYIKFAVEEKRLFRLLFMRDRHGYDKYNEGNFTDMAKWVQSNIGLPSDKAEKFHLEIWVYVHGIAVMLATGFLKIGDEDISTMLTDMYQGLRKKYDE